MASPNNPPFTLRARRRWQPLAAHVAALVAVLALTPGAANAVAVPKLLRAWLQASDHSPSAAQLRRASPHVVPELEGVARDVRESRYARHRAVALLSRLGADDGDAALTRLRSVDDVDLRGVVAMAIGAGPGARTPGLALASLGALLADSAVDVRASAARALALVRDRRAARATARARRKLEASAEVRALLERVERAGASPPAERQRRR